VKLKQVLFIASVACILHTNFAKESITYLYSHSLATTKEAAYSYAKENKNKIIKNKKYIIDGKIKTFDYPDATRRFWRLTMFFTSLGQKNEIAALKAAYDETLQENHNEEVIPIGRCRGASVIAGMLGAHNPEQIAAAILESPFDDITKVFEKHWFIKAVEKYTYLSKENIYKLFTFFSSHNANEKKPIDYVKLINKDIPLMIVCKKGDNSVPFSCTKRIYDTLIRQGKKKTHLLMLDKGIHGSLLWTSEGTKYQDCIHAFYRHYKLPHNKEFALRGQEAFEQTFSDAVQAYLEANSA